MLTQILALSLKPYGCIKRHFFHSGQAEKKLFQTDYSDLILNVSLWSLKKDLIFLKSHFYVNLAIGALFHTVLSIPLECDSSIIKDKKARQYMTL